VVYEAFNKKINLLTLKFYTYLISKRVFDILFSSLVLIALSPLFLLISILVKNTSSGPILFKGNRTGKNGIPFEIFKFRSMYVGSEMKAGSTSRNDSRITSIGKFIRKYKIDELPQLINVFKGEMSFVGPRPELKKYTDQYKGEELLILKVKPGITDLSSIKFSNLNDLIDDDNPDSSFENKILASKNILRIEYVKKATFFGDLKLIFLTILKLLNNR
jgi:lipopolysaccharide/colanic/teichoic acid biosynthesis glycosyltransferase